VPPSCRAVTTRARRSCRSTTTIKRRSTTRRRRATTWSRSSNRSYSREPVASAKRNPPRGYFGEGSGLGLSAGVARLQALEVVDPVVPAPARQGLGRRVGLDVGRRDDGRRANVVGGGRVGRTGQAEGGAADDACRDDREGEIAGEAGGVHLSFPVSVDFWCLAPVCSGDDSRLPCHGRFVCPVIGGCTGGTAVPPIGGTATRGPLSGRQILRDGGQCGQVLVDGAQPGAHRVHRYVGGAGGGPLGEFVCGL